MVRRFLRLISPFLGPALLVPERRRHHRPLDQSRAATNSLRSHFLYEAIARSLKKLRRMSVRERTKKARSQGD